MAARESFDFLAWIASWPPCHDGIAWLLSLANAVLRAARLWLALTVVAVVLDPVPLGAQIAMTPPDPARIDADTRAALVNRIDTARRGVGMVVGILSATVAREETRLYVQATGNPRTELKAQREGEFFDVSNPLATISFTKDTSGRIVGLVLHLPGIDVPAQRVQ
jgi:hypothetical protein